MATFLPAPQQMYQVHPDGPSSAARAAAAAAAAAAAVPRRIVPPYSQRQSFVPRTLADFGDGGAYPEVHVAQYPLNMGRPGARPAAAGGVAGSGSGSGGGAIVGTTSLVSVDVDESGKVRHDAIVKQGTNKDKLVYSRLNNTREKEADPDAIVAPSKEEEEATTARTNAALARLLGAKVDAANPLSVSKSGAKEPEYIKYTPKPDAPGFNPAAGQRIIRMVEAQVDPMEPPKHKHKKVPRGPPEAPVPVLHSPPRKTTAADQQAWKIPPCISNWKNARGFVIPLDKRLAADGRGLQDVSINTNFATLSESLYIAERKAREETRLRGEMQKQLSLKEKEAKENELRDMAARARMERAGLATNGSSSQGGGGDEDGEESDDEGMEESSGRDGRGAAATEDDDEQVAAQQRERLRAERKRDREREIRLDNMKGKNKKGRQERERDVSEKIALGQHKGAAGGAGAVQYDQRLFNQSAGMDSGFGAEDGYGVYSKDLFDKGASQSVYRPRKAEGEVDGDAMHQALVEGANKKFKADKGFMGTEGGAMGGPRTEPVQFERNQGEEDPFGLDSFLAQAKKGNKG